MVCLVLPNFAYSTARAVHTLNAPFIPAHRLAMLWIGSKGRMNTLQINNGMALQPVHHAVCRVERIQLAMRSLYLGAWQRQMPAAMGCVGSSKWGEDR